MIFEAIRHFGIVARMDQVCPTRYPRQVAIEHFDRDA